MRTVAVAFEAVRPGDVYPSTISVGEAVEGRLLEIAEALGAVVEVAATTAPTAPVLEPEKPRRGRPARAPETKG